MNLATTESFRASTIEKNKLPIIEAVDLGVKYIHGSKREDLQSLSYEFLFKKNNHKKEFWALKGVSFTGHRGEILGIIGSNGAGKTTLCRVLSGLLKPDLGTVSVNGSVTSLFSLGTGFNQQLTGRENIFLNGLMLGLSKKDVANIMPEIMAFSGLGRFIEEPLKIYSKGMKARLGFSIAAMVQPEILIIDEALSAGDLAFSEKAAEKMQELVGKSKLVIIVSHKIDFIKKYCTRALWIDGGMVKFYGDPDVVTGEYTNTIPESSRSKRKSIKLPETNPSIFKSIAISANKLGLKYVLTSNKRFSENHDKQEKSFFKKKEPFWALSDVSFTVNSGEVIGIIGANGSGKTTLCRVLTKILKHDAGHLTVNGDTTALLSFGTGFNQQLSGKDNVFLNGLMLGIPQKRLAEIYNEIVSFSGLSQFINMPVKHYSSGMRARLGFSIASAIEPDIFIIDEALNAGDAAFAEKASARIQQLMAQAKAVIVVTHSFAFVEKICTRAILIEGGKLTFDGKPAEAIAKYKKANKKQNV